MPRDLLQEINQPLTGDLLVDRQNVGNQPRDLLAEISQPESTTGNVITGKVPISQYNAGQRNLLGNIVERPAAVSRAAIAANPMTEVLGPLAGLAGLSGMAGRNAQTATQQQSINPNNQTLQNLMLDAYYKKFGVNPLTMAGGNVVSAAGLARDVWSNPAQMLTGLLPKMPVGGGNTLGELAMNTRPMQALKEIGNTPIENLGVSKALVGERGGIVPIQTVGGKVDNLIDTSINKAIRPSVVGKSTATQTANYYTKARQAVQAIYDNKNNLVFEDATHPMGYVNKLPESLNDFSSAIDQTKQQVFNQYDTLAKQAGQEGVNIPLSNISKELNIVANNKVLQDIRPEVANYAKAQAERFSNRVAYTPEEAQQAIKIYNQSLEAFYKNPTPDTASKAVIDSGIVNNLRKALDDSITSMPEKLPSEATAPNYQQLKNIYAALKTIEKDVNRRAIVDARKNVKGLIDFTDVFSGGQMAKGILTLNPQEFATGFVQKMIAGYIRYKNNPNTMIKNMFRVVERVNLRKVAGAEH